MTPGSNHIVRKSTESSVTVPDPPSMKFLMEKTDEALANHAELDLHEYQRSCGIPDRMLLPKGKTDGMDFVLFVALTNGDEDKAFENSDDLEHIGTHSHCGIHGEKYPDKRPMGYPLDRHIPDKRVLLETTNVKQEYVKVYHDDRHDQHH